MSNTRDRTDNPDPDDPDSDEPRGGWFRRFVRRAWKPTLGVVGIGVVAVGVLVGVAYAKTPIPDADAAAKKQATIFYYRDGKTPLFQEGMNRESVSINQVPKYMQKAVLAAEDRNFYNEPGVSPKGIARAFYSTITGKQVQGGSTITQQFARNYYSTLSRDVSITRKFKEIMISLKLDNKKSKDWVLEQYLNTINFGNGAWGIQAAAKTYFDRDVGDLTPSQAAYLAGIIQSPNGLPDNPARMKQRWNYVKNGMAEAGWLTPKQLSGMKFPKAQEDSKKLKRELGGQKGYLYFEAKRELIQALKDKHLGGEQRLSAGGMRVVTTFSKKDVRQMAKAVHHVAGSLHKTGVKTGAASIDPRTGEVIATYGGIGYRKNQFDHAFQGSAQAGSSFKPYVLATALKQGYGLGTTLDGRSPVSFDSQGNVCPARRSNCYTVHNDSGENLGVIPLLTATSKSINTAYVELGLKVGLPNVIKTAEDMGVPADRLEPFKDQAGLALGQSSLRPVDQAAGYATFANQGTYIKPHVIRQVTTFDGTKLIDHTDGKNVEHKNAFDSDVSADATYAMQQVVKNGTASNAMGGWGRPAAGKTGTTDKNKAVWFAGYVPQRATAVGMWRTGKDGKSKSLRGIGGYEQIYGGNLPTKIWREYMTKAMQGAPVKQFPPPAHVGDTKTIATPPPEPTHTARPQPTHTRRTHAPQPTPTHSEPSEPTGEPSDEPPSHESPEPPTPPQETCYPDDPTCDGSGPFPPDENNPGNGDGNGDGWGNGWNNENSLGEGSGTSGGR